MPRNKLEIKSAPSVELNQRQREARLRLEGLERIVTPRPAVKYSWLRWSSRSPNARISATREDDCHYTMPDLKK